LPVAVPMCLAGIIAGVEHLLQIPVPWTGW
jgi:hypothetical protein